MSSSTSLDVLIIADNAHLRFALSHQILLLLQNRGLPTSQVHVRTVARVADAVVLMCGNPPLKVDLVLCWELQPERDSTPADPRAVSESDQQAYLLFDVLSTLSAPMPRIVEVRPPLERVQSASRPADLMLPGDDWLCADYTFCQNAGTNPAQFTILEPFEATLRHLLSKFPPVLPEE